LQRKCSTSGEFMIEVVFCHKDEVEDEKLEFAVIVAVYNHEFVFCRHKKRTTWEVPGGHREAGESVDDAAKRELYEESGAVEYKLSPITVYGVKSDGKTTYGMLYYAYIAVIGDLPADFEIAEIMLSKIMPENLTYPEIQPKLWAFIRKELNLD